MQDSKFFADSNSLVESQSIDGEELALMSTSLEAVSVRVKDLLLHFEHFTEKSALEAEHLEIEALNVVLSLFLSLVCLLTVWLIYVVKSIIKPLTEISLRLGSYSLETSRRSTTCANLSAEVSQASLDQAGAITETSASSEEIHKMAMNNVVSADSVFMLSTEAKNTTDDGMREMNELVLSIDEIRQSTRSVEDLIKVVVSIGEKVRVIDEIVFQTKLLSFNASVEAERAGEHGRGFAVVAQEVGNLATMSGKASIEIAKIVKESIHEAEKIVADNIKKVDNGVEQVQTASDIFVQISKKAEQLVISSRDIATASKEQEEGSNQINTALIVLDQKTSQISAGAKDLSSISADMREGSLELDQNIKQLEAMTLGGANSVLDHEDSISASAPSPISGGDDLDSWAHEEEKEEFKKSA